MVQFPTSMKLMLAWTHKWADKDTYKPTWKMIDSFVLNPETIQEILDWIAQKYKPNNLFLNEMLAVSTWIWGVISSLSNHRFLKFTDDELYKIFFQNFDELDFSNRINLILSELHAMQESGVPKQFAITSVISVLQRYFMELRNSMDNDNQCTEDTTFKMWLLDEVEKRLVERLNSKKD